MIARMSLIKLLAIAGIASFGVAPAVMAQVEAVTPAAKQETVPSPDIATIVSGVEGFSTLEAALAAADLTEALMGEGPFTVIAPTNDAFAALPDGVLDALLLPENKDLLTEILTYHVISGEVMYADLEPGMVATLGGEELTVTTEDDDLAFVNGIQIVGSDIPASNGLVHVIQDGVLVPADVATELESRLAAAEEEPMVEETMVEETMTEETAPAAPVRGLW